MTLEVVDCVSQSQWNFDIEEPVSVGHLQMESCHYQINQWPQFPLLFFVPSFVVMLLEKIGVWIQVVWRMLVNLDWRELKVIQHGVVQKMEVEN